MVHSPVTINSKHDFLQDLALAITIVAGLFSIYHLYHDVKITKLKLADLEAAHTDQKK